MKNKKISNLGTFKESNINDSHRVLSNRLRKSGYLFFKKIIPLSSILKAKVKALKVGFETKLLNLEYHYGSTQINKSLKNVDEMAEVSEEFVRKFIQSSEFNSILNSRKIRYVLRKALNSQIVKHPSSISQWARVHFPESLFPRMLPHQDFNYVGKPTDTYSVWVPLTDCPKTLGGLSILEGSHLSGYLDHGLMKNEAQIPRNLNRWLTTDFNIGDVLIFHSHTVHGALPNLTPDTVRLALDLRFCKKIDLIKLKN